MDHTADFFNRLHRHLEMPKPRRAEVTREIESHRREIVDDLMAAGADEPDAEREALNRLGSPDEIASELNAVHYSASLKSALMAAVPFLGWAVCLAIPIQAIQVALGSLLGAVLVIGCVRELVRGGRPVWLATWLATSYAGLWHVGTYVERLRGPLSGIPLIPVLLVLSLVFVGALTWKSQQWRRRIAIPLAVLATCAAGTVAVHMVSRTPDTPRAVLGVLNAGFAIALVAFFYIAALRLFADSAHGGAWRASLFLFAYCASLDLCTPLLGSGWLSVLSFAAVGLATIPLVMGATWQAKASWLAAGLLVKFALFDVIVWVYYPQITHGTRFPDWSPYVTGLLTMWAVLTVFSLAPMLGERARRESRLTLAR